MLNPVRETWQKIVILNHLMLEEYIDLLSIYTSFYFSTDSTSERDILESQKQVALSCARLCGQTWENEDQMSGKGIARAGWAPEQPARDLLSVESEHKERENVLIKAAQLNLRATKIEQVWT